MENWNHGDKLICKEEQFFCFVKKGEEVIFISDDNKNKALEFDIVVKGARGYENALSKNFEKVEK